MTDPAAFYNGQDFWTIPNDPTKPRRASLQPPYYLTLQMPGTAEPTFSLTTTFSPRQAADAGGVHGGELRPGDDYGTIRVLQLPRNTTIPGPTQVQNNFESDPAIAEQLTLLRRGGSEVEFGNLLSLPVGGGLLYVEPVYVRAAQGQGYPLLRKVLVTFGNTTVLREHPRRRRSRPCSRAPGPDPEGEGEGTDGDGGAPTDDAQADLMQGARRRPSRLRGRRGGPGRGRLRRVRDGRRTSSRTPWTGPPTRSAGSPATPRSPAPGVAARRARSSCRRPRTASSRAAGAIPARTPDHRVSFRRRIAPDPPGRLSLAAPARGGSAGRRSGGLDIGRTGGVGASRSQEPHADRHDPG